MSAADQIFADDIRFDRPYTKIDWATLLGLCFAVGLIIAAIAMGKSNANFLNVPALMIVLLGTMAATAVSYTGEELARAGHIISKSLFRQMQHPDELAKSLMDVAVLAKKSGVLLLSGHEAEFRKDPFLHRALQMAIDGTPAEQIERLLVREIESLVDRHKRSASITRRASEVAPAMGLIGTLVGLVQMLAELENPEMIGPAMAVALLTTFYGAILGTVIMAPLAVKLEKHSADEAMLKSLIGATARSIAAQENPRALEMELNAILPPADRIEYFD